MDLCKEGKKRTFWNTLTVEEQRDADLLVRCHSQGLNKKNFLPTRDVLERMWEQLKPTDIVITRTHPNCGSFSDKYEQIEVSEERKSDLQNTFSFSLKRFHGTIIDKFFFSS
jgi:hypothetical protein